jgi:subtilase family serine protease
MQRQKFVLIFLGLLMAATLSGCKPDLVPANPGGWAAYCDSDDQNNLKIHVKNQGNADAPASTTLVEFFLPGGVVQPVQLTTPPIPKGQTVTVGTVLIPTTPVNCFDPDCDFNITVDSKNRVEESKENNNKVKGTCIG